MASRNITRNCSHLSSTSSSAARAFLQLAPRRQLHSTPFPGLDFLLPSVPRSGRHHVWSYEPASRAFPATKRAFTSCARRQQTAAIFNPRKDDDGNDMSVEITPRASNRLREIMSKDSNPNLALRIQVESGGCHGFQYLMSLTTLPSVESFFSNPIPEDTTPALNTSPNHLNAIPPTAPADSSLSKPPDTQTGKLDEDDTVFTTDDGSGAKVVMDRPSLELLKGSKIDFTMELIGSQFKIVDNPLATSSCGCGTSFDIKT